MLKFIAALGVGSALVLTPVFAFADESTTPPKPDTVKTPGNGPDVMPMHHHHHHHHHHMMHKMPMKHTMPMKHHMKPMAKPAMEPAK